jgi:hypothetical protein
MTFLAVLVGSSGMLLGFVVLADFVVMSGLQVMVSGSTVTCRCFMMVLGRRMFALVGHNESPGCWLGALFSC